MKWEESGRKEEGKRKMMRGGEGRKEDERRKKTI